MEPTKLSSSLFLSKYFHILHLCVSLGLVIAVVHNQLANNTTFDKLEHQISCIYEQSNRKADGSLPINKASQLKARNIIVKRDAFVQSQQRIKKNSTNLENEVKNNTYSRRKEINKDKEKYVVMCLDMLRTFVKINKSKLISEMNVCGQLRGPSGKRGPRGSRGKRGKRGLRGLSGQLGNTGSRGSQGKHGPPGPRGEKGFSGNVTVIGLKGDMGPIGDKGHKGNQGMNGLQGIKGSKGSSGGPKGDRGQHGEKGESGPRGCSGDSFAAPQFYSSPRNLVFSEREPATLFCNATSNPYSHITWYRDNVRISSGGRYDEKENVTVPSVLHSNKMSCDIKRHPFTQSSLVIKQSRAGDTGNYFCEARNLVGFLRYQITLLIQVYVQFNTVPLNITVVEKDNVQLSCRASGVPSPLITWHRKDGRPMPSVIRVILGDLHIIGITKQDEGVYECVASNVLGSKTTDAAITVNVFPVISHFHELPTTINESQTLHIPCNATGFPAPLITWIKSNDSLPNGRYAYNSQRLTVSDVRYEDGGEYVCTANNTLGAVSNRTRVVVQAAPKILQSPGSTEYGYQGYNKTIVLKVFAFPPASIEWMKNGKRMEKVSLYNYSLILPSVHYRDSGFYQAVARNILGEVRVATFLIVRDPVLPAIITRISETVSLCIGGHIPVKTCSAVGNPQPKIVWKHNGTIIMSRIGGSLSLNISNVQLHHAGRYTCEASNSFGKAKQYFNLETPNIGNIDVQTNCNHQQIDRWTGRITSPRYPFKYSDSQKCSWLLTSICNIRITLSFKDFDTESCCDKVQVYDGSSSSAPSLGTFSGSKVPSDITSSSNKLYVTFNSDRSTVSTGFAILYQRSNT